MKRIIAAILLISIIFTLCSCKKSAKDNESYAYRYDVFDETDTEDTERDNSSSGNSENSDNGNKQNNSKGGKNSISKGNGIDAQVKDSITTDAEITEPYVSGIINKIGLNNVHTPVSKNSYYRYSLLSDKMKSVYNSIETAVMSSKSIANVSKYNITEDDAVSVFGDFLSDNPQYFYVSRYCMVAYGSHGKEIRAIILLYTDGTKTDEFDNSMNLTQSADRSVINSKIAELKSKTESVIGSIPSDTADYIKERIIHDYIAETVSYNENAADNIKNVGVTVPHDFDVYGAAVNCSAVCEGYSKWFQYLCYCVGINSTQVSGTSNGGGHMWNTVNIQGEWYYVDVTWNDTDIISYRYYNLDFNKISKDHTVDSSTVAVPDCISEKHSFINDFAVCVSDLGRQPDGYETVILNTKQSGSGYIYIFFTINANKQRCAQYISRYMLKNTTTFYKELANLGISLSNTVNRIEDYYVLSIK